MTPTSYICGYKSRRKLVHRLSGRLCAYKSCCSNTVRSKSTEKFLGFDILNTSKPTLNHFEPWADKQKIIYISSSGALAQF